MASEPATRPLVICSKSSWYPPIRREHAWATLAAGQGHPVTFIAAPRDVRSFRTRGWWRGWRKVWAHQVRASLTVEQRSVLIPAHRGEMWRKLDAKLLRRAIEGSVAELENAALVCIWPWDWPAAAGVRARRRVFDMTDDWGALVPRLQKRFLRLYRQIGEEADEIVIVNPKLAELFPGRTPVLIRNGVDEAMIDMPRTRASGHRMVYVGTVTERFDAPMMRQVMDRLEDWTLDIVGACMYAGLGDRASSEFEELLSLDSRVRWHGALARPEMTKILDRATVAIVPNRPERSRGQDSMKMYDYAARGLPIVSTSWQESLVAEQAPHVFEASEPDAFAEAVRAAAAEPSAFADARRRWARENTWRKRWPEWSAAVFGGSSPG